MKEKVPNTASFASKNADVKICVTPAALFFIFSDKLALKTTQPAETFFVFSNIKEAKSPASSKVAADAFLAKIKRLCAPEDTTTALSCAKSLIPAFVIAKTGLTGKAKINNKATTEKKTTILDFRMLPGNDMINGFCFLLFLVFIFNSFLGCMGYPKLINQI
ncbi:MAG: hypothetical protein WC459_03625 [Patescibacteria group bacterium]